MVAKFVLDQWKETNGILRKDRSQLGRSTIINIYDDGGRYTVVKNLTGKMPTTVRWNSENRNVMTFYRNGEALAKYYNNGKNKVYRLK